MSRTWEDNAEEFRALSKQGVDVRLAVLIAASVERGTGGRRTGAIAPVTKVSATEFAEKAGTTKDRVTRHLDAWTKCAAEGWCADPKDINPEDALNQSLRVPTEKQFKAKFDASKSGGRPRASIEEIVDRAAKDEEYAEELASSIAEAAPKATAKATRKSKSVRAEIAKAQEEEAAEALRKAGLVKHTGPRTPEEAAVTEMVAARNAVSEWQVLLHTASIKLHEAEQAWAKIEGDLNDADIYEANATLVDIETNAVILRQRASDRHAVISNQAVQ